MGRFFKFLIFGVLGLIALAIVGIGIAILTFDPNDYRDDIEVAVKESTGRDLSIAGDLKLKFYPWLAVEVGEATLSNREGFGDQPMFALTQASLALKFAPLFSGNLEVGEILIDGAQLNLSINKQGVNNWDDIAEAAEADTSDYPAGDPDTETPPDDTGTEIEINADSNDLKSFQIAGINFNNLAIRYSDEQAGTKFFLEDFRLKTSALTKGANIDLDGGFNFASQPQAIAGDIVFTGEVLSLGENDTISIDNLNISGTLSGEREKNISVSVEAASIVYNSEAGTLDVIDMQTAFAELKAGANFKSTGLNDEPRMNGNITVPTFSPAALAKRFAIELPEMASSDAMTRMSLNADVSMQPELISLSNLSLKLDDTSLKGKASIKSGKVMHYTFDLAGDQLNVDNYMAPATDNAAASGEAALDDTEIPSDLIAGLSAAGQLSLQRATMNGLEFANVQLGINAGKSKLRLHPLKADLFDGNYSGDISINTAGSTPVLSLNETINSVNLGPLAQSMFDTENLSGTIDGRFTLSGRGSNLGDIRKTLGGDIAFVLADGALEGQDIWHQIRKARALFKREPAPKAPANPRTEFSDVSGTGKVANGIVTNDDFKATLPFLRLTGRGTVDLAQSRVNYRMDARVLERPDFVDVSADELDEYTEAVIPIKITGALSDPSIAPDISALARAEAKKKIDEKKDELRDKLLGELGLGKKEEADPKDPEDPDAIAEEEPEDAEEALKEKARDALKDLFK